MIDITDLIKSDPKVDGAMVLREIYAWADSLTGDFGDDIVLNTLEGVVDIIIDNCELD